jgi:mannosyltransferase OCH1-like enzyme
MIPKKIHYCWFGGKPLSELTIKCIESWRKYLPDYEIIEWNESNYDINQNKFAKEAYENKKFAFVSDICRLFILQEYGGIYLDTDMEIIKPINNVINDKVVLGFEDIKFVAAGVIIAPKKDLFIQKILSEYEYLTFPKKLDDMKNITIPLIITNELVAQGLKLNNNFQTINGKIDIFPSEYFYPLNFFTGKTNNTQNTLTIHHYESSWMTNKQKSKIKFKIFLINIFGENFISKCFKFLKKQ